MTSAGVIVGLCAAILLVLLARALWVVRREREAPRGSPPGKGVHTVDASYHSGGLGGGHSASFTVPRDPQDYAKRFVPKHSEKR